MDGNNRITGTDSADDLDGTSADNYLEGQAGDDVLNGQAGADTYDGGAGNDRYVLSDTDAIDTLYFNSNDEQQDILDVSQVLPGRASASNLNDFLKVNQNGVFIDTTGRGLFTADSQIARFSSNNSSFGNVISVQIAGAGVVSFDWSENGNTPLTEVTRISGTDNDDTLTGDSGNNRLVGGQGDDRLSGGEGIDFYDGGAGSDTYVLDDQSSIDVLKFINNETEADILDISAVLSEAEGVSADNIASYLKVTEQAVFVDLTGNGRFKANTQIASFESDSELGESIQVAINENTTLSFDWKESSIQFLSDSVLSESLVTNDARGHLVSRFGERFRLQLDSRDLREAFGGDGDEELDASSVEAGDDVSLYGRAGRDTLIGNDDGTLLDGGEGNDRLVGGNGANVLFGGEGADEFVMTLQESSKLDQQYDIIDDFTSIESHRDVLDLQGVLPESATEENLQDYVMVSDTGVFIDTTGQKSFTQENQLARFGANSELDDTIKIRLPSGSDVLFDRVENSDEITGDDSDEVLKAGDGRHVIRGEGGDDILDGGSLGSTSDADELYGGSGNDELYVDLEDLTNGAVEGDEGYDRLHLLTDSDQSTDIDMKARNIEFVAGGRGNDTIDASGYLEGEGSWGAHLIDAGERDASGTQRTVLLGEGGEDTLTGGEGRDYLDGGDDNDYMDGGAGRDFLAGGAGEDVFALDPGDSIDMFWDFTSTEDVQDRLDISALVPEGFTESQMSDYLLVTDDFVYFDSTGQGNFTDDEKIAEFGDGSTIETPVTVVFNDLETSVARNDAPEAGDPVTATVEEDNSITLTQENLLANASDSDGDSLTASNLRLDGEGVVTDNGDGTFTVTPNENYYGDLSIDFDISDGNLTVSSQINLTVTPVDDPLEVSNLSDTIDEDQSRIITTEELLESVNNLDDDELAVESVRLTNDTGVLTENDDGTWTFSPNYNQSGTDAVLEYTISDGTSSETGTYTFAIDAVADGPRVLLQAFDMSDPIVPLETADFSDASEGVTFDITSQDLQTIGGGVETNAWDATEATGSDFDDVFTFNDLQAGETYTINGGDGRNTINLDQYRGDQVTIDNGNNTITVDVDGNGNTATINYSNITDVDFRSDVFDGTPHGIEPDDQPWEVTGTELHVDSVNNGQAIALVDFEGTLDEDFTLEAEVMAHSRNGLTIYNGSIIFDYQDENNYKAVTASIGIPAWRIQEYINGNETNVGIFNDPIPRDTFVPIELRVEGSRVSLVSDGDVKTTYDFGEPLNDGRIGVKNYGTETSFRLNMAPSNWAPSVQDYDVAMNQTESSFTTANVLNDAENPENEVLTIDSYTQPSNGSVTDNGDGTFDYTPNDDFSGVDTFTYVISDGTNTSTGTVRINVIADDVLEINEGGSFQMDIDSELTDTDGSETLTVFLEGVPVGSVVSDGTNSFTVTEDNSSIEITDWDLTQVQVEMEDNFTGWFRPTVRARAEEENGDVSETTNYMRVSVRNVNDAPETEDNSADIGEDSTHQFQTSDFAFNDVDSGANFSAIIIKTLPENGQLLLNGQAITANRRIAPDDIENLTYESPRLDEDLQVSFDFAVSDGQLESETKTFTLNINNTGDDFEVAENSIKATTVGTVSYDSDEDVEYVITGGNEQGYFRMNRYSGDIELTEAGSQAIDANDSRYNLTVSIREGGVEVRQTEARIQVNATVESSTIQLGDASYRDTEWGTELLSNGDFQDGLSSGWSTTGDVSDNEGAAHLNRDADTDSYIEQTISARLGMTYQLDFDYAYAGSGGAGIISIIDADTGTVLATEHFVGQTDHESGMSNYSLSYTSVSDGDVRIRIEDNTSDSGSGNELVIDNVSMTAPEHLNLPKNHDITTVADLAGETLTVLIGGGWIENGNETLTADVTLPSDYVSGDAIWASAYHNGTTKAVKLVLTDTDNGIQFSQTESAYIDGDNTGADFDNASGVTEVDVAIGDGGDGYGAKAILLNGSRMVSGYLEAEDRYWTPPEEAVYATSNDRVALPLSIINRDTDGSETQVVTLTGVPAGSIVIDGVNNTTFTGNAIDISGWDLDELHIVAPENYRTDYTVSVTVTNTESDDNSEWSDTTSFSVIYADGDNFAPTSADKVINLHRDADFFFSESTFEFDDLDGDAMASVTITSLPGQGSLTLNGEAVSANDVILVQDLKFLRYHSADNNNNASLSFRVNDGESSSEEHTLTFDPTWIWNNGSDAYRDSNYYDDNSGRIFINTFPDGFETNTQLISNGNFSSNADGWTRSGSTNPQNGRLFFDAANGGRAEQSFDVHESGVYSISYQTMGPTGLDTHSKYQILDENNNVVSEETYFNANGVIETRSVRFTAESTGSYKIVFLDESVRYDTSGVWFLDNVIVQARGSENTHMSPEPSYDINEGGAVNFEMTVTTPSGHTLRHLKIYGAPDGTTVTDGTTTRTAEDNIIDLSGMRVANLTITPPTNFDEDLTLTVFQEYHHNTSGQSYTNDQEITINITPVEDNPDAADNTVTLTEDGSHVFSVTDFNADDVDGNLSGIVIVSLPDNGRLTLNEELVTANQQISIDDLDRLIYTPPANANGEDYSSFTFQARDSSGNVSGTHTLTLNVEAINDAPEFSDSSQASVSESASNGTLIKTFTATDAEGNDFTFSLANNAGGRFRINPNGELRINNAALIDFEDASSHDITVKVTDSEGRTSHLTETITVTDAVSALESSRVEGNELVLTYTEAVSGSPGNDEYALSVAGTDRNITNVSVDGAVVTVTFDGSAPANTESVQFSYTGNSLEDSAGSPVPQITNTDAGLTIHSTSSDSLITGSDEDDLLIANHDGVTLAGGQGADVFFLDDNGTTENPADFTINDFNHEDGDVLKLDDLLVDSAENLDQHLSFSVDGNDTVLEVRQESNGDVTKRVTFKDVDLTALGNDDSEIINNLLDNGNLDYGP